MAIEDIPEMQVTQGIRGRELVDFSENQRIYGYFIVLEGPISNHYVMANDLILSDIGLLNVFRQNARFDYGCNFISLNKLRVVGEGYLDIDESRIRVTDDGCVYGGYDEQVIKPIVEKWARENLKSHSLVFESKRT